MEFEASFFEEIEVLALLVGVMDEFSLRERFELNCYSFGIY